MVNDVTWASWRLKQTRLLIQQPFQVDSKENVKVPHQWLFVRGIHRHKGSVTRKACACHDVIMSGLCRPIRQSNIKCHIGTHGNGKVVRVTTLIITGDVEDCLQRHQWRAGQSCWHFRFSADVLCIRFQNNLTTKKYKLGTSRISLDLSFGGYLGLQHMRWGWSVVRGAPFSGKTECHRLFHSLVAHP